MVFFKSKSIQNTKVLILIVLLAGCRGSDYSFAQNELVLDGVVDPQPANILAWVPFWDQKRAMNSYFEHADSIDFLSMFWYYLTADGRIKKYNGVDESPDLIKMAQDRGADVFALIANSPDNASNEWDAVRVRNTISNDARRQQHIEDLVNLTLDFGFDGINIDYEALDRADRDIYSRFIQELSEALHIQGKLLAIALHPKTAEYRPSEDNGSHAQDWKFLSSHADQLHFMTYGEHVSGDEPGPVASVQWVENIIKYAIEKQKVPISKLFIGMPLYAEAWKVSAQGASTGLNQELTHSDILTLIRNKNAVVSWDEKSSSPYIEIQNSNGKKEVYWFENHLSLKAKLILMKHYNVANLAMWRIGGEDPQIWNYFK